MSSEIWLSYEYAEIKEVKLDAPNENGLRVYCEQFPNMWKFQIRTHGPITEWGGGKDRDMIANVTVTIEQVEEILRQMKAYAKGE